MATAVCFPEPTTEDPRWGGDDPDPMTWLVWSTLPQAQAIRRFLNASLAALPSDAAAGLCRRFRTDPWRPVLFEIVVGRFLQVLGASLEYEPAGANGRKVDWFATFPDGYSVYVEATSPVTNAWMDDSARANAPLLAIIEAEAREGWSVWIHHLPPVGPQDSKAEFRRVIRVMMAELPDAAATDRDERLERAASVAQGPIRLGFTPVRYDSAIVAGPASGGMEDSAFRLADAVHDKRPQGRAFPGRVVLAVDVPHGDREDADVALLGRTHQCVWPQGGRGPIEFRPDGELARQKVAEFAAVLVFTHLGMLGGRDPKLYHHPKFTGELPAALSVLEQHRLASGGIIRTPATDERILDGLGFPLGE